MNHYNAIKFAYIDMMDMDADFTIPTDDEIANALREGLIHYVYELDKYYVLDEGYDYMNAYERLMGDDVPTNNVIYVDFRNKERLQATSMKEAHSERIQRLINLLKKTN